ncbi:MAG: HlyD family efflux transporter periplasmic adaptor subunit [Deltaproteobacteria bacterium]|nr:HlyD family efflux transporter periplasmic adaptor subunit [Deltaproteobacteria bacterium]
MKKINNVLKAVVVFFIVACSGGEKNLKLSGTLEYTEHAVGARVAGRVDNILIEEGHDVKKGQQLATLDRYAQAKRDHERLVKLFKQGGATEQAVEQAKLSVDDQEVVAPVDGVVLVKLHEAGEIVPAGGPIAVVGDDRKPWVRVYVSEDRVSRVHLQQEVTLRFDGTTHDVKGRITYISPKAEFTPRNVQTSEERVNQTFAVKIAVDDPERTLKPGVSADVVLSLE